MAVETNIEYVGKDTTKAKILGRQATDLMTLLLYSNTRRRLVSGRFWRRQR